MMPNVFIIILNWNGKKMKFLANELFYSEQIARQYIDVYSKFKGGPI